MLKIKSQSLRLRLLSLMTIILIALLGLALPSLLSSYQLLVDANEDLKATKGLNVLAQTANKISSERAFANNLMSDQSADLNLSLQALNKHRAELDQAIQQNIELFEQTGYSTLALQIRNQTIPDLERARRSVDEYAKIPMQARNFYEYDAAVQQMFLAWDSFRQVIKAFILEQKHEKHELSNYMILVVLLTDLRDQAGRVASNIIAPVSFNQPIPATNQARTLQTQHQTRYLWELVDTLYPEPVKTPEYQYLYQRVEQEFLQDGIGIVNRLLAQSLNKQPYSMTSMGLTQAVIHKFVTILDLQSYLLDTSLKAAALEKAQAEHKMQVGVFVTLLALAVVAFTMYYAERQIIAPLVKAREQILNLSKENDDSLNNNHERGEFRSLFKAISRLDAALKQRDQLELQLRNMAHTDTLTGTASRSALNAYLADFDRQPERYMQLCLMMIDIDNFKRVNDEYGHLVGDYVIQLVASHLQNMRRRSDLIVRYGGDEFLLLIEGIDLLEAEQLAEKLRTTFFSRPIELIDVEQSLNISLSIGIALGAADWPSLFQKADQALFQVKANGKNGVQSTEI